MALTVKKVAKLINAGERGRFFDAAGLYLVVGWREFRELVVAGMNSITGALAGSRIGACVHIG